MASLQAYSSHGIQYYRIVESFRNQGKPSIRVLAHLGRVDEILRRHQQHAEVPVKVSSVSAGAVTALFGLARELDVAGLINNALSGGGEVQVRAGLTVGESLVADMIARATTSSASSARPSASRIVAKRAWAGVRPPGPRHRLPGEGQRLGVAPGPHQPERRHVWSDHVYDNVSLTTAAPFVNRWKQ